MNNSRKGSSIHVDVLVSLGIFVAFIIFMFVFLKPLNIISQKDSSLTLTENSVMNYLEKNLTVISFKVQPTQGDAATCYSVDIPINSSIIIKDQQGNVVQAKRSGGNVLLEKSAAGNFYQIYISEDLEERTPILAGCAVLDSLTNQYTVASRKLYNIPSYKSIISLFAEYNADYTVLKQELKLKNDFNIVLKKNDSTPLLDGKGFNPRAVDIMAKDIPLEIFDENATMSAAILNIQVWK